ncbi:group III truncated hemoglobin [Candidatus Jidaibacter acanthamoebae]|nr:group III truncated hemoglobin [Candidatus Jidaibacter acanthamoeba]
MTDKPELASNFCNNVGLSLGITEPIIENLVHSFYIKVREDELIAPIFDNVIEGSWDEHLSRMCDFWSSIVLSTGRYKGQPLLKHINIPNLHKEHFLRWLSIFEENAYNTCSKEIADFFIDRARKIAQSLMLGIKFYNKELKIRN